MLHNRSDLEAITSSINEIIRGIGVENLELKCGFSEEKVLDFEGKVDLLADKMKRDSINEIEINWTCDEIQLIKSLLCILLQELDHFEFSTRLGFQEEEVWRLLKYVREELDGICYPRSIKI